MIRLKANKASYSSSEDDSIGKREKEKGKSEKEKGKREKAKVKEKGSLPFFCFLLFTFCFSLPLG
jgi:hypothetical protein